MASVPSIDVLFRLLESADVAARLRSVWVMGEAFPGERRCIPYLSSALDDPDTDVRGTAAEALGKTGALHPDAVEVLVPELERGDGTDHQARVAYAFGRAGPGAAPYVSRLIDAMEPRDGHLAAAGLWALGEIGPCSPGVLPTLIRALASASAEHRYLSAGALGWIGREAMPATVSLVDLARDDPHPLVRGTAAWALAEMGCRLSPPLPLEWTPIAPSAAVLRALAHRLRDDEVVHQREAVVVVGELGPAAAMLSNQIQQLLWCADEDLRGEAAEALGKIGWGRRGTVRALAAMVSDVACMSRARAAWAVGWAGPVGRHAAPDLIRLIDDSPGITHRDIEARWAAAWTLGRIGVEAPDLLPVFIRLAADPESDVRFMAAECIGFLAGHGKPALGVLERLAKDPHPTVRRRAAWAMAKVSMAG